MANYHAYGLKVQTLKTKAPSPFFYLILVMNNHVNEVVCVWYCIAPGV